MARFVLKNVVIVFPKLFTPVPDQSGKLRYSTVALIAKDDPQLKNLNLAIRETAQKAMTKKWNNIAPKSYSPLKDGDGVDGNGNPYISTFHGFYFLNVSATEKPGIVDEYKTNCEDPKKFYPGCHCHISIDLFGYQVSGKKGISARLVNIMWASDGTRLGGDPTPEEDFADIPVSTKPASEVPPQDSLDFGLDENLPF